MLDPLQEERIPTKLHEWNIIPKQKSLTCGASKIKAPKKPRITGPGEITWTVSDISKAACLLTSPPINAVFEDEQEMRRVYTLIYDVFRYKNVMMQALNDIAFFQIFPKLQESAPHVWLLFYDLYHRSFKKRETSIVPIAAKLFASAGLTFTENALWTQRIKLAASVSRLRIKHNALTLGELLPPHLKDGRVTAHAVTTPVTCWINNRKVEDSERLCKDIEKTFNLKIVHDLKDLGKNNFKWDRHCPQIIAFHNSLRTKLARSNFIQNHKLIVQDRSFCLGPATFEKLVTDLELTGSVIQTHVNSPRTTAYLAALLSHNEKIKKLMAFSAGKRKMEYETYFNQLGMSNVVIFSDRLIDTPLDAHYMEEVVAVFATPPNSYSAVSDPIDLVCSRGGDLSMLEVLTESEETKEGRDRVANILEEQRKTLRFAMSRPQIQFVLYETHSELEVENNGMVQRALREMNRVAKLQHAALQGKVSVPIIQSDASVIVETKEINNNENLQKMDEEDSDSEISKRPSITSRLSRVEYEERLLENITVPNTDIFDIPKLPNLCPNESDCVDLQKEGCFLALLQRKQVIRLDDKYMIQMAENRGLFGSNTTTNTSKSKTSKSSKKKQEIQEKVQKRVKRKLKDSEEMANDLQSAQHQPEEPNKNIGITAKDLPLRNIIGRMTSFQYRQLISPHYKPPSAVPAGTMPSKYTSGSSFNKLGNNDINYKYAQMLKKKAEKHSKERANKSKKITKENLKRICSPTQAYLSKTLFKREKDPDSPPPNGKYEEIVFACELCKKRNEKAGIIQNTNY